MEDAVIAWIGRWWRCLVAVTLVLLMQGPAMVMQEVAWARMLVSYTQERGLLRGLAETFDGEHPCEMCLKVREIREEKRKQDPMDSRSETRRMQFSWAEMVPVARLSLPGARESGAARAELPGEGLGDRRVLYQPPLPPPKRVG